MRSWKIAALLALLAAAAGCAGNPPASEPAQQVQPTSSSVTISSVEHASGEGATSITLKGNFPFSYTSYEPDYSTMVLELLDVDATPIAGITAVNSPEVESLETSVRSEGVEGGKVSQVTFHFKRPTLHQMKTEGNDLRIDFQPDPSRKPFPENAVAEGTQAPTPLPEVSAPAGPSLTEAEKAALDKAQPATALLAVLPKGPDAVRKVQLKTNGKVDYKVFELSNPARLVIDMENVQSQVPPAQRSLAPKSEFLGKIRVAQFATAPKKVARVVFDLKTSRPYEVVPGPGGLTVDFSDAVAARKSASPDNAPALAKSASPESVKPAAAPESTAVAVATPSHPPSDTEAEPLGVNLAAQTPAGDTSPAEAPAAGSAGLTPLSASTLPEPAPETTSPQDSGNEGDSTSSDLVPMRPAPTKVSKQTTIVNAQARFSPRTISDNGQKYTGKRISLNFKDADLKDVFRIFHEISGYNIVLDPSVSGNVTIVLDNVPEDQALDIILKNNGLDKVFENNVIRIASTSKLSQEAAARKTLQEAKELEEMPVTFTRALSYARAKDVAPIVKRVMSKRGDVATDDRTNTLIISDISAKREPINRLIDSLDE